MTFTGTKAEIQQFLFKQLDKDIVYDLKIDKHRNEISNVMRLSKEEVHFQMLKDYGQRNYECILASVTPWWDYYEYQGTFKHAGNTFKSYLVYKPTHKYNSKEMAIFIDGLVQECRNLGIETLEDLEIKQMIEEMERNETHE